jgi:hypothetical protein
MALPSSSGFEKRRLFSKAWPKESHDEAVQKRKGKCSMPETDDMVE